MVSTTNVLFKSVNNGGHVGLDSGYDIVFTSADGATKLAHEIEKYDPATGQLIAWVKTNLSSSSDTVLYLYYGNSSAPDMQTVDPVKTAVWDSNYKGVWHLGETGRGIRRL
ncbi:MAG: DUF2341 domain-containing protein [Patescibacteria group bacterium]|nr:DUF2341 domain-containing protein [Patescibacteria group bacterium]